MELATKFERQTEVKEEVKELLRLVDRHIMPLLEDFNDGAVKPQKHSDFGTCSSLQLK